MTTNIEIRQSGFRAELAWPAELDSERQETAYKAVIVENAIGFSGPGGQELHGKGEIQRETIQLRFNNSELQETFGTEEISKEDWNKVASCVFTMTAR